MRRLAVLAAVVALAAAWSDAAGGDAAWARPAHPRSSRPAPSEGCGGSQAGRSQAGGVTTDTVVSGNAPREYRLAVPAGYTGKRPLPLVLNFHGFGSGAVQQAVYSELEEKGPRRGYLVVTPQGTGAPAFWNILPSLPAPDDVAHAGTLIDRTASTHCVDLERVYSTGISNGAGLSAYLGCNLGNRLAAIAPVAGVNLVGPCAAGRPLSVIAFHGVADMVVPYEGGATRAGMAGPVEESVAEWADRAGCGARPRRRTVSEHVRLLRWSGCDDRTEVLLYAVLDGGHTWPGSIDVPRLGATTLEINATDLMLDFFAEHARR